MLLCCVPLARLGCADRLRAVVLVGFGVIRSAEAPNQWRSLPDEPPRLRPVPLDAQERRHLLQETGSQLTPGLRMVGSPGGCDRLILMEKAYIHGAHHIPVVEDHGHGPVAGGQIVVARVEREIMPHILENLECILRAVKPGPEVGGVLVEAQDGVWIQVPRVLQEIQHPEERGRVLVHRRIHERAEEQPLGAFRNPGDVSQHLVCHPEETEEAQVVFRELLARIVRHAGGKDQAIERSHHLVGCQDEIFVPCPGADILLHQGMQVQLSLLCLQPACGLQVIHKVEGGEGGQPPEEACLDAGHVKEGEELQAAAVVLRKPVCLHESVEDLQERPVIGAPVPHIVDLLLWQLAEAEPCHHRLRHLQIQEALGNLSGDQLGEEGVPGDGIHDGPEALEVLIVLQIAVGIVGKECREGTFCHLTQLQAGAEALRQTFPGDEEDGGAGAREQIQLLEVLRDEIIDDQQDFLIMREQPQGLELALHIRLRALILFPGHGVQLQLAVICEHVHETALIIDRDARIPVAMEGTQVAAHQRALSDAAHAAERCDAMPAVLEALAERLQLLLAPVEGLRGGQRGRAHEWPQSVCEREHLLELLCCLPGVLVAVPGEAGEGSVKEGRERPKEPVRKAPAWICHALKVVYGILLAVKGRRHTAKEPEEEDGAESVDVSVFSKLPKSSRPLLKGRKAPGVGGADAPGVIFPDGPQKILPRHHGIKVKQLHEVMRTPDGQDVLRLQVEVQIPCPVDAIERPGSGKDEGQAVVQGFSLVLPEGAALQVGGHDVAGAA